MGEKRRGRPLPPAVYIVYLLVLTVILTGVTFSGYISSASGSDGARVAKFEIVETGVQAMYLKTAIVPGETQTKALSITNKSEVAVTYRIIAENLDNNLPLQVQFYKKGDAGNKLPADGTEYFELPPNSEKVDYVLEISWNDEEKEPGENPRDPKYAGMIDRLRVQLYVEQKD